MEPPLSHDLAKGLRILLLYLTLACLSRNFDWKLNDWFGRASCSLEKIESGRGFSKFCARFARNSIMEPPLHKSCIRHWTMYKMSSLTQGKPTKSEYQSSKVSGSGDVSTICFGFLSNFYDFSVDFYWFLCWFIVILVDFHWFVGKV